MKHDPSLPPVAHGGAPLAGHPVVRPVIGLVLHPVRDLVRYPVRYPVRIPLRRPALALAAALAVAAHGPAHAEPEKRARWAQPPLPVLMPAIRDELSRTPPVGAPGAAPVDAAAAPAGTPAAAPLSPALPKAPDPGGVGRAIESLDAAVVRKDGRFDLNVANASPAAVFAALAHDTRLSILVDPAVKNPVTINLKDVTLREALDALHQLYEYEYRVVGRQILVQAPQMLTRVMRVDYPVINRSGRSEVRVLSGSISNGSGGSSGGSSGSGTSTSGSGTPGSEESSRITTQLRSDIWGELEATLKLLVPDADGGKVAVSPQTGTVVVRAMPRQLREVERYLAMAKLQVERQVMIEAKIIEVNLSMENRTGINWAAFRNKLSSGLSVGMVSPGASLSTTGTLTGGGISADAGLSLTGAETLAGGLFGLAFQTANFAAVLSFLESQGTVQVLSSPRIATLNNQKAVLKVGTDDFFVTNISTTTNSVGNSTQTTPNITVQPFFSGIALDVTPQIDEDGQIILHIHPQVSTVRERNKVLNLGSLGNFTLPLASSTVNESDSLVRVGDGSIFAIGGLMQQEQSDGRSGLPGTGGTVLQHVFGQTEKTSSKQELVILLKPTVVTGPAAADALRGDALERLLSWLETEPKKPLP